MSRRPVPFDLDSTVVDAELLPFIGAEQGLQDELAHLMKITITSVISFETSFRHRVSLLMRTSISRIREIVAAAPLNESIVGFTAHNPAR